MDERIVRLEYNNKGGFSKVYGIELQQNIVTSMRMARFPRYSKKIASILYLINNLIIEN